MAPSTPIHSSVHSSPGWLNEGEVAKIHAFASTQQAPEQVHSRAHDDTRVVRYLSYQGAFRRELPWLYERLRAVALAKHVREGGSASDAFEMRVAEYHTVTPGGGLFDRQHVDAGSLVTVDVMLSDGFEGGVFYTLDGDGEVRSHADVFRRAGDMVAFHSLKRHHVGRVTSGERRVLVVEFWDGVERDCPHRCEKHGGICDAKVHDAVVPALGQFADSFFDVLDLDTVRDAMAALADEEGAPIVSYAEAELDRRRRVAALRGNAVCS